MTKPNPFDTVENLGGDQFKLFSNAEITRALEIKAKLAAKEAAKRAAAEATSKQAEENQANTPPESRP